MLSSNSFLRSSIFTTSAGITGALLHSFESWFISPMRKAIGALVKTNSAPSSKQALAVFQAMLCSFSAPKMIPFFPFNKLYMAIGNLNMSKCANKKLNDCDNMFI